VSRFNSYDHDEYDPLAEGRWFANLRRAIRGQRGQRALRDLREALLALPDRRLIAGDFATPQGEVCTVGCVVAYKRAQAKGVSIPEAAKELAAEDPDPWDGFELNPETGKYERQAEIMRYDSEVGRMVGTGQFETEERWHDDDPADYTATRGERDAGMAYTLAWHLGWKNDEDWRHLTPEQRWDACLKWVESKLAKEHA
jgi:hypothetical protein